MCFIPKTPKSDDSSRLVRPPLNCPVPSMPHVTTNTWIWVTGGPLPFLSEVSPCNDTTWVEGPRACTKSRRPLATSYKRNFFDDALRTRYRPGYPHALLAGAEKVRMPQDQACDIHFAQRYYVVMIYLEAQRHEKHFASAR